MKAYSNISSVVLSILIAIVMGMVPGPASSKIVTNVPADISGEELMAVVIEDFENAKSGQDGWWVESVPKKFEKAETEQKLKMKNPVVKLEIKVIPGFPNDMNVEEWSLTDMGKKKEKCLGVSFKFRYPGANEVSILPPPEIHWKEKKPMMTYNPNTGKDEQERGVELPGQAKAISIWVHGRGLPYHLELWLKDYKGATHILKFGSVNFVGWRPLKVHIPVSVPQTNESYPQTRITKITRFVLRADQNAPKEEMMQEAYFFFDQLKVLTDKYEVNFDGENLHRVMDGDTKGGDKGGEKKQ